MGRITKTHIAVGIVTVVTVNIGGETNMPLALMHGQLLVVRLVKRLTVVRQHLRTAASAMLEKSRGIGGGSGRRDVRSSLSVTDSVISTTSSSGDAQVSVTFTTVLFCSVLDPRVGHTMDVLSPIISVL